MSVTVASLLNPLNASLPILPTLLVLSVKDVILVLPLNILLVIAAIAEAPLMDTLLSVVILLALILLSL